MNTQKSKPSKAAAVNPAEVDDRKPGAKTNNNAKSKLRRSGSTEFDVPVPISVHGEPCVVYDLTGSVQITLPAQWRTLIGKAAYEECLADLRSRTMTIVSRERGVVVYVRLSTTFTELAEDVA